MKTTSGDWDSPGVMPPVPNEEDFEKALRRALQQAAECVEAKGDGLTRIFRRLSAPWLVRQVSLLVTDCVDLFELVTVWLQPMPARTRSVQAAARHSVREAFRWFSSPAWLRKAVAWLRPTLAAAITAMIVMTGTVALSQTVARIELSGNRPAGISAVAGTAPATGGHRQSPASGLSGPARKAPPAGAGGTTHQHSCESTRCSAGPAGAAAPEPSTEPSASPRGSATPAPKPKHAHHHPHQSQGPHYRPDFGPKYGPYGQHHGHHQTHDHHRSPAGAPGD
jgi:hypothetical protein